MGALLLTLLLVPRPVLSGVEQTAPSATHAFLVHFTTTGADAIAHSGDVDAVIGGIDRVMAHWVDAVRMRPPLADGGAGGDARLDVYLRKLDGPRGNTYPEDVGAPVGQSAWIELDTRSAPLRLAAAAGHETHHAIEYAYSTTLARWIYEATAAYVEHGDFSGGGLEAETDAHWAAILSHPEIPLDTLDGVHEYDALTFVKFLADRDGRTSDERLAALWEAMAAKGEVIDGIESVTSRSIALLLLAFASINLTACDDRATLYAPPARCHAPHAARVIGVGTVPSKLELMLPPLSIGYVQMPAIEQCTRLYVAIDDVAALAVSDDSGIQSLPPDGGTSFSPMPSLDFGPLRVARGRQGPAALTLSFSTTGGACKCPNGACGGCGCTLGRRDNVEHTCMFVIVAMFLVLCRRWK